MMKTMALAMMTSLVGFGATASAQPSVESESATSASRYYGDVGGTIGMDDNLFLFQAITLEGGMRIGDTPFWVRGSGAIGTGDGFAETNVTSTYVSLRTGIEARGCLASAFCAFTGLDAGFRHESLMSDDEMIDANDAVAYPRFGFDIGTRKVRLRQTVEVSITGHGIDGFATTLAIAHDW